MEPLSDNPPLVAIVGQTASGKSALAMDLAQKFDGEIIAADSRTVYKDMDIGTAKPSVDDRHRIPHHLINLRAPDQDFNVADFQKLAQDAVADIAARGRVPILVGGSGLYVDSVIYNFTFRPLPPSDEREKLNALSVDELRALLEERGIALPKDPANPRRLIRALETGGEVPMRTDLRPKTLLLGLSLEKDMLGQRIHDRVDHMIEQGIIAETKKLADRYSWDAPGLQSPGYQEFRLYLDGQIDLEEAKRQCVQAHLRLAKRQKTWFKRNPDIRWISNSAEAVELVTTFLNNDI